MPLYAGWFKILFRKHKSRGEVLSVRKKTSVRRLIPVYAIVFVSCLVITVFGSRAITVMSESSVLKGRTCIVIDAGHGGVDGGATSCTGVLESTINLEIALRLNDLMNFLGYKTFMIRTTDISVYTEGESIAAKKVSDLKQRVKLVNGTDNALLISIHQNYFSDSRYSGGQVFYATTPGSELLAKNLQKTLVATLNQGSGRQAKKSTGVYLMEHIDHTGILFECGFLSNFEEEKKLRDPGYQKKLCCVIAFSVSNFLTAE